MGDEAEGAKSPPESKSKLSSSPGNEIDPIASRLPWGAHRERTNFPEYVYINPNVKPGEYVLQTLFAEYTVLAEKKIEQILEDKDLKKPIAQYLQKGQDTNFDQLLCALGNVAEQALPSLLKTLFAWYDRQHLQADASNSSEFKTKAKYSGDKNLCEKRDLAVDFIYCLVLIDVLKQLPYHPGHDDLVTHIINQTFRYFKEGSQNSPNASNLNIVADLHAEVIGVLAQSRFSAVRKRFLSELNALKSKDQSPSTTHSIISLLMGMKFFRVKMVPIEEFEMSVSFLQECGQYFLEVRDKDVKHALAGMFVEILLPVAAVVKNEVNVPVLKNFVEMLYSSTLDMSTKKKHCLALYPMVTCLLCVSQKQFFLSNWPTFLTMCLSQLKNRDPKMARVALESLYRLVWVYVIRIKCESNTATQSRLQSIVNSLFPKGSKVVMPKDMPLNIFVKIVQFIAQERLDFAMREIIFDLLCVGRQVKVITPERMSVGLRAFLVIADSLQQKEGEPPMPQTMAVMPSGNTIRHKKTFLNKTLTEETARMIGVINYYTHVCKAFDAILKQLDSQVGKPLMLTKTENANKEPEEMITGERKPKIDLLRTCVAAIPRLLPDGITRYDLIDLLARLTVHMDEELGKLAFQSLQKLMEEQADWRQDVLREYVKFVEREVTDPFPQLLEQAVRRLIQLISQWRTIATQLQTVQQQGAKQVVDKPPTEKDKPKEEAAEPEEGAGTAETPTSISSPGLDKSPHAAILHEVEGFALVMLCSNKPIIRKLAVVVLKEVRNLFTLLGIARDDEPCVLDVVDKACPLVVEKVIHHLPQIEKTAVLSASPIDFQWLADRTSIIWSAGFRDNYLDAGSISGKNFDPWVTCITSFMHYSFVTGQCDTAVAAAWPLLYNRLTSLFTLIDPTNIRSDRSSSILGSSRKGTSEKDLHMTLWQNYVIMACTIAPPSFPNGQRSLGSDILNNSPDSATSDRVDSRSLSFSMNSSNTARDLFKLVVPLIRSEANEVRETVITGLGNLHPSSFRDIVDELIPFIKEAIDRKQENVKRRRRRDILRVTLARIFHYMAQNGIFGQSPSDVTEPDSNALCITFVDYIDGARLFLENESDKENPILHEIRLHFTAFIRHLIRNVPVCRETIYSSDSIWKDTLWPCKVDHRRKLLSSDLRKGLFKLFGSWSGKFGQLFGAMERRPNKDDRCSELEISSVQAMSAVLCCGPVWDPLGLNDDSFIYTWLDTLLGSHDEKIYKLAQETVVLLLEYNSDAQALLDWVIDRCYTGSHEVADGCFNALSLVFNNREYPCDHVAMLNVTLLNTGCPRSQIKETAVHLFHLLYKRFFLDDVFEHQDRDDDGTLKHDPERRQKKTLQDALISGPFARSPLYLSEILALLHPELTIPMFSEITHRFQTAIPAVRQLLLQYVIPWLHNMELVDPNLPPPNPLTNFLYKFPDVQPEYMQPPLKGEGWGSTQATEMVLNNLFYITAKFSDDHPKEIEELWANLVSCWHGNLRVIIRYIVIVTGMAPNTLLPCAKRVILYLGRAKPERLVDEIMTELQTVEALTFNIERTQTPPFFRLTALNKRSGGGATVEESENNLDDEVRLDKGQIHTKRRSGEDPTKTAECTPRTNSTTSLRSESSVSSASPAMKLFEDDEATGTGKPSAEQKGTDSLIPFPLPMPAYGGFFAPLSEFLPESNLPNPPYQRCNLAVMLLSDLIVDGLDIDWTVHLPLMLHIIFLGLDHSRPLIHEHCKRLLLNLLLALSAHNDHFEVARILLSNKTINEDFALTLPNCSGKGHALSDGSSSGVNQSTFSINTPAVVTSDSVSSLIDVDTLETTEQVARALIEFLVTRRRRPLWSYEDITAKVWSIKSAEQLEHFLKHVLRVFKESVPSAHIEQRWAHVALQLALSCSSRHYAGRSLQVFRALRVPLSSQNLSDILSRLVETVAEHWEDMQGYVTELMLTLEACVDNLDLDIRPIDFMKELFMSTPNLSKELKGETRKASTVVMRQNPPIQHFRSTSCTPSVITRRMVTSMPPMSDSKANERQHKMSIGDSDSRRSTTLSRSRSAQSLKHLSDPINQDDKLTILSQMFWLAVCVLESDYEHEFLLAVRLLDKILKHLQPDRPECREKLEKIQHQLNWPGFPGVQALLLKGCTSPVTAEATWTLLSKLTQCIQAPVIDPSATIGFPMNVIALLPYLVEHYESPNKVCTEAAEHISQKCMEQSSNLDNLATVMTFYSRGTFAKDNFQWTKCVIKYLYDVYANLSTPMIAFLVEVLEKGPSTTQLAVIQILYSTLHYVDVTASPSKALNSDLLKIIAKYVEHAHWRDALKILKLAVSRSSTFAAAPPTTASIYDSPLSWAIHTSFAEAEISFKQELPGRTMDFTFDMNQAPIIGHKHLDFTTEGESEKRLKEGTSEITEGATVPPAISDSNASGWKRPQLSQSRTRDRLVNLLTSYGRGVCILPKSPSVIFSQSSDTLERQASVCSSPEEGASTTDAIQDEMKFDDNSSTEQQLHMFDFLDKEMEDDDDENVGVFNWGMERHSVHEDEMTIRGRCTPASGRDESECSDDEFSGRSESPMTSQADLARISTITLQGPTPLDDARRHSSPLSGSTHSINSAGSDVDTTDLSHSNESPVFSGIVYITSAALCGEEIEDAWKSHVNKIMVDGSAAQATHTFYLFSKLFQHIQRRLIGFTKDVCSLLARCDGTKRIVSQLRDMLDLLATEVECPLVYADQEMITSAHLLEKLKYAMLEVSECYDTYLMKKDQAVECLDSIRSSQKLHGDHILEVPAEEQVVELCRCLYKLDFQVLLLYEGFNKLVNVLSSPPRAAQVQDLSKELTSLKQELQQSALDLEQLDGDSNVSKLDPRSMSRQDAEGLVMDCIRERQYSMAVQLIRNLRSLFPSDLFGGLTPSDDIEAVLLTYCRLNAENKPGVMVITRTEHEQGEVCSRLMELNVQLSASISQLDQQLRPDRDTCRLSKVSSASA